MYYLKSYGINKKNICCSFPINQKLKQGKIMKKITQTYHYHFWEEFLLQI